MNLSKAIQSVGTLTLLNFARKHQEKLVDAYFPTVFESTVPEEPSVTV